MTSPSLIHSWPYFARICCKRRNLKIGDKQILISKEIDYTRSTYSMYCTVQFWSCFGLLLFATNYRKAISQHDVVYMVLHRSFYSSKVFSNLKLFLWHLPKQKELPVAIAGENLIKEFKNGNEWRWSWFGSFSWWFLSYRRGFWLVFNTRTIYSMWRWIWLEKHAQVENLFNSGDASVQAIDDGFLVHILWVYNEKDNSERRHKIYNYYIIYNIFIIIIEYLISHISFFHFSFLQSLHITFSIWNSHLTSFDSLSIHFDITCSTISSFAIVWYFNSCRCSNNWYFLTNDCFYFFTVDCDIVIFVWSLINKISVFIIV